MINCFANLLLQTPDAKAEIKGSEKHGSIRGTVNFYRTDCGTLVAAEIAGLPHCTDKCSGSFFGFHIHSGKCCSGNAKDPFADAGTHYNPTHSEHPCHTGDLPVLAGNGGYALSVFLTDRFTVSEVIGKTAIIHSAPDDFTTQPSGNTGEKIACGIIKKVSNC